MILTFAQLIPPGEGDNAYIWLCGVLGAALVYMFKVYNDNRSAELMQLREERQKERDRNDVLLNSIPEMVAVLKELKDALINQPK